MIRKKLFKTMTHKVVTLCLVFVSPILRLWEKDKIKQFGMQKLRHQPIFIIGSPRTGSTILYQSLTNCADVLYVDNLVCLMYRNFFAGFWLTSKLFKQKAHNCFQSVRGSTRRCGWHAPSECGSFWYRWLPKNKHFVDYNEVALDDIQQIKLEITAVSNYFNKPIVFKNLNAGQRLRMLAKAFPEAKFVFIRRDPAFTAQSILKAKRKLNIPDNQFWSIMPSNVDELKRLDWPEQIVKQIYYLEKQIVEDLKLFPEENVFEINYTDLTQDTIKNLIKRLGLKQRESFQNPVISLNEKVTLSEHETHLIQKQISNLDWLKLYDK